MFHPEKPLCWHHSLPSLVILTSFGGVQSTLVSQQWASACFHSRRGGRPVETLPAMRSRFCVLAVLCCSLSASEQLLNLSRYYLSVSAATPAFNYDTQCTLRLSGRGLLLTSTVVPILEVQKKKEKAACHRCRERWQWFQETFWAVFHQHNPSYWSGIFIWITVLFGL